MENKEKKRTECLIFSRVCGWLVPYKQMNLGKQQEKKDLVYFKFNKEKLNKD